jgi:serine/threonine protein kinase
MIHVVNKLEPEVIDAIMALQHGEQKELFHPIGDGKSGQVVQYKDYPYAIKLFKDDAKETNDAFILNRLQHSNFFPTLHAFQDHSFMVTELVGGKTIYEIDEKNGLLIAEYERYIEQAEMAARQVGLIPSDVHLNNLMIDEATGELKIIDVGNFKTHVSQIHDFHLGAWGSSSSSSSHYYPRRNRFTTSSSFHRKGHRRYGSSTPRPHRRYYSS